MCWTLNFTFMDKSNFILILLSLFFYPYPYPYPYYFKLDSKKTKTKTTPPPKKKSLKLITSKLKNKNKMSTLQKHHSQFSCELAFPMQKLTHIIWDGCFYTQALSAQSWSPNPVERMTGNMENCGCLGFAGLPRLLGCCLSKVYGIQ